MDSVLDKARELAMALTESEEYLAYKEAESIQLSDQEACKMLADYRVTQDNLAKRAAADGVSKEELEAIQAEAQASFNSLLENVSIKNYLDAQSKFSNLVSQVNNIISYFVSGQASGGGCGGNCASCGGCH